MLSDTATFEVPICILTIGGVRSDTATFEVPICILTIGGVRSDTATFEVPICILTKGEVRSDTAKIGDACMMLRCCQYSRVKYEHVIVHIPLL